MRVWMGGCFVVVWGWKGRLVVESLLTWRQRALAAPFPSSRQIAASLIPLFPQHQPNPPLSIQTNRYIDDIIDPAETRQVLCKELEVLRNKNVENPPRKHSNVPL